MANIQPNLKLVLQMSRLQAIINRKLDGQLSIHGLGFTDFIILYHLSEAPGEKLRRVDLAEQLGVTASGITRMLAPMEKIGLVSREANERDARISYVVLAPGGRQLFEDSLKTAHYAANDLFPAAKAKKTDVLLDALNEITGR